MKNQINYDLLLLSYMLSNNVKVRLMKLLYFNVLYVITSTYTANVYRRLQGLYGEIRVRGFQIYGDCMNTRNPCNFEISTLLISM